jgi:hypothetical protein
MRTATAVVVSATALISLGCDRGARKDLEQDNQMFNTGTAVVYLNPDKFPNITHKCDETTGMWTTTQGNVWIVYNDRNCGGEGPVTIFDNIPGGEQGATP